ncbi:double-stranded RNA-binding protein Staufen homolog 2-like [Drosophila subobscura]|uniref:double-stranded RNA-binding protein Staufen homolog 2-like n=1 Tax=Drosophila subobscura TaxID=7241 RepID=UPI00155AEA7E|nr:double-stranded RNA-binding protein Staufen homolog 2-like [Drosophila subobscura]
MSAVSSLEEFCAKSKTPAPKYDYIDGEDGGYVCKVIVMEIEANGNGRSKRDSRHSAAANMLKKLRTMPGLSKHMSDDAVENGFDNGSDLYDELGNLKRDMVKELRDYCLRHETPLPFIEIVQQCGTRDAPEYLARCTVASIMRYGKSDTKRDARQRAAIEMLSAITVNLGKRDVSYPLDEIMLTSR